MPRNVPRWPLGRATLGLLFLAAPASAAELTFGAVSASLKVRPNDRPPTSAGVQLRAARNEFEAFQVVLSASGGDVAGVSVRLASPLTGTQGTITAQHVTLYRVEYYQVGTASNNEGAPGPWPDPLIPDVDPYVGERRNAFPLRVPNGQNRVVWVDILAPLDANPGLYEGALAIEVAGATVGTLPIALYVGSFALPSTASLKSAFHMDYAQPCVAHTGVETCDGNQWDERKALELRERYVRAGLEHRFSISDPFFQPPILGASAVFDELMLPSITGTGRARLPGARLTTVRLGGNDYQAWLDYARAKGFAERLFYFPVDEPSSGADWDRYRRLADALHAVDANAKVILTVSIDAADERDVLGITDILVPVVNHLEERPNAGTPYDGTQRPAYDAWLAADSRRELWSYQSCMSHGCGDCGTPSPLPKDAGWPNRVIDTSAVQNRAFPWIAFTYDIAGELYFHTVEQLDTAWEADGQCAFSGSGDGTILYPGQPERIGGTTDIPIESIRMKMIREGMEDYEYLRLVARQDRAQALNIARGLFAHTYDAAQAPERVEAARAALFALLDGTDPPFLSPLPGTGAPIDVGNGGSGGQQPTPPDERGSLGMRGSCSMEPAWGSSAWWVAWLLVGLMVRRRYSAGSRWCR